MKFNMNFILIAALCLTTALLLGCHASNVTGFLNMLQSAREAGDAGRAVQHERSDLTRESFDGRPILTADADANLDFRFTDTSLDPYVRSFEPRLSPYTSAIASGPSATPTSVTGQSATFVGPALPTV